MQTLEEHQEEIAHLQAKLAKYESGRAFTNEQRTGIAAGLILAMVVVVLILTIGVNKYYGQAHGQHLISRTETYSYNP